MNLFYIISGIWLTAEILLNRLVRSGKGDNQKVDSNTERYLWIVIAIAVTLGVYVSFITYQPIVLLNNFSYVGMALMIAGILLRIIAIKQLGKYFTVDVTIRQEHQLMQSGLYKHVRHPSYTGVLLAFLGLGITFNNWYSLLIIFIPVFSVFVIRMSTEEKALLAQFGEAYKNYINNTKRLLPFIY
ncbi:isoprenylcysteine carboxylmethyltransferase family protein [Panacibacter sp. DH6]|uniref:Isoprenylcysteine carboxylmethyltransferase family protein n=1 Tax=Panacibacter microcysteis TaxID=2793269 RepID=A0A931GZD9_9BACT|nr:isoprenylcysteine carboxylmethyltransferase family protein [Panacibacter microcysteis]MBG9378147.1 isoprenylcysteine carboxylmethyltransferase family protein [Panacibacter microcysteis]